MRTPAKPFFAKTERQATNLNVDLDASDPRYNVLSPTGESNRLQRVAGSEHRELSPICSILASAARTALALPEPASVTSTTQVRRPFGPLQTTPSQGPQDWVVPTHVKRHLYVEDSLTD